MRWLLSVRRQRSQLAMLQDARLHPRPGGGGGRRPRLRGRAAAVAIGVPLGAVAGRWGGGWSAEQLGVAIGPVVPLLAVAAVAAGAIIAANLVAALPAWRAARTRHGAGAAGRVTAETDGQMEAVVIAPRAWCGADWRATIFLALLAGLAGGIAMGAWTAGRRTASSFDRLVERTPTCPTRSSPSARPRCTELDRGER